MHTRAALTSPGLALSDPHVQPAAHHYLQQQHAQPALLQSSADLLLLQRVQVYLQPNAAAAIRQPALPDHHIKHARSF